MNVLVQPKDYLVIKINILLLSHIKICIIFNFKPQTKIVVMF